MTTSDLTTRDPDTGLTSDRRIFIAKLGLFGLGAASATGFLAACGSSTAPSSTGLDQQIINAAATAEALASVMYDNIIKSSPAYAALGGDHADDQRYLAAGREQEAIHYMTLVGAGAKAATTDFYFPTGMFTDTGYATTVNTLVTLEDAFIAAYLIGVRDLSTDALKQLAAQILGIECEHRALARIIAADLNLPGTKGLSGVSEPSTGAGRAPNNLAFERTFSSSFKTIDDIVTALGPFIAPGTSGFDTTKFSFDPTSNFYVTEAPTVTLDDTTP
ncbi:MAG TPA: ferritin-like domain-containing protein [Gemmatimonadaceae bacterium]|nr:ferritin-like domain-containing protein [Gemmatimonadaceae bacterium]